MCKNLDFLFLRQKRLYGAKNGQILETGQFSDSQEKEKACSQGRAF